MANLPNFLVRETNTTPYACACSWRYSRLRQSEFSSLSSTFRNRNSLRVVSSSIQRAPDMVEEPWFNDCSGAWVLGLFGAAEVEGFNSVAPLLRGLSCLFISIAPSLCFSAFTSLILLFYLLRSSSGIPLSLQEAHHISRWMRNDTSAPGELRAEQYENGPSGP